MSESGSKIRKLAQDHWIKACLFALLLGALLFAGWWVYHPGLSGDFLFDDFGNLPVIGATGPIDHWATFWRYITSGIADPTGRPLTLLSFLLDARDWPASPWPFKVTNVLLHLLNGALLCWVLLRLGRVLSGARAIVDEERDSGFRAARGPAMTAVSSSASAAFQPGVPTTERGAAHSPSPSFRGWPRFLRGQNPESAFRFAALDRAAHSPDPSFHGCARLVRFLSGASASSTEERDSGFRAARGPGMTEMSSSASAAFQPGVPTTEPGAAHSPSPSFRGWPRFLRGQNPESAFRFAALDRAAHSPGPSFRGWPRFLRGQNPESAFRFAALFGAGAWLLHPLFVSTTLYVVQREAMLPATFALIGILGWIAARESLARGHIARGITGMLVAAWGCTLLATLSKANGALLPLLLLLIEWIVLAPHSPMRDARSQRLCKRAVAILLMLPSVLLLLWMLAKIPAMSSGVEEVRDWTIGQRLLTEPRVLTDYLRLLFVPQAHSSGLFNDAFPASTGWLHPHATLPCIIFILALIGAGFALRKRHPAIALALLFYFAAQLMESSWIPLELYYEHRNYLPAMLLFWPIGIGLGAPGALRWLRALVAAGILLWLGSLTLQRASLWGNGYSQAQIWAAFNPDSPRAQANAAGYDMAHDRPRLAAARLRNALPDHPDDLQIPVNLIGAECRLDALRPQSLDAARHALSTTKVGGTLGFQWFNTTIELAASHACNGLDFATVQSLLDAAKHNPRWQQDPGRQQDLAHLQGLLALAEGRPDQTLRDFNHALALEPRPDTALEQAGVLGSHHLPRLGLAHLDYYATLSPAPNEGFGMARVHTWVLRKQHYWKSEIKHMRATLQSDVAAAPTSKASSR